MLHTSNLNVSQNHVGIKSKDMDYFFVILNYSIPGIYKFNYEIEYMVDGERGSDISEEYCLYFPSVSEIYSMYNNDIATVSDIGEDRGGVELTEENMYIFNNIYEMVDNNEKTSNKMRKAIEKILERQPRMKTNPYSFYLNSIT